MLVKIDDFKGFFYGIVDWHELGSKRRVNRGKLAIVAGHDRNPAAAGDKFAGSGDLFRLLLFENAAGAVNRVSVFVGRGSKAEQSADKTAGRVDTAAPAVVDQLRKNALAVFVLFEMVKPLIELSKFVGMPGKRQKLKRRGVDIMVAAAFGAVSFAIDAGTQFEHSCVFVYGLLQAFDFLNLVIEGYHLLPLLMLNTARIYCRAGNLVDADSQRFCDDFWQNWKKRL